MKKICSLMSVLFLLVLLSACTESEDELVNLVLLDTFEKEVSTDIPEPEFEDTIGPIFFTDELSFTISDEIDLMKNVEAKDNVDGFVTDNITYSVVTPDGDEVNDVTSLGIGRYIVTYEVSDEAGNVSQIERLVKVTPNPDVEPPIILGTRDIEFGYYYLDYVYEYIEDGVTAHDDVDGMVTTRIKYNVYDENQNEITDLMTLTPGTYKLVYSVSDRAGNVTSSQHSLNIIEPSGPIEYDFENITVITPKIDVYDVMFEKSIIRDNFRVKDGNGYLITDLVDIRYYVEDSNGNRVKNLSVPYLKADKYTVYYRIAIEDEVKVQGEFRLNTICYGCVWGAPPPIN